MKQSRCPPLAYLALCLFLVSTVTLANDKTEINAGVDKTLQQFVTLDPAVQKLTDGAAGILVFPRITQGLAVAGDAFGEGALRIKGKTVTYYSITAASVGLNASGVAPRSDVIVFTTQAALDQFTANED